MPRHTEPSANNALGNLLQGMLGQAVVRSENTQVIQGHPGLRPDIVITATGRSPVVIESEYLPATTVEDEARSRLGLNVAGGGMIEAAIGLRYPSEVGDADDLSATLSTAAMDYCVFTKEGDDIARFPESGWRDGSAADLADLVRLVSLPQNAVDQAAGALESGINRAAAILDKLEGVTPAIAHLLGMDNVPQTRRMACAIIANAMIFHDRIARIHPGIKTLKLVCGPEVANPQSETLAAWTEILEFNYWPVFAISKDILQQLPARDAALILEELENTAGEVNSTGIDNAHDLTGRVFQRLISDRKYLATFYTLPASAALLARLAVAKLKPPPPAGEGATKPPPPAGEGATKPPPPQGEGWGGGENPGEFDWADPAAIASLRVGDFACGTGALLSAVYGQIAARHESAGGDAAAIHPAMMEEVLYGCDVMPSAIHITGSTLSGVQPEVGFDNSRLYTMPYGRQDDGAVKIGSLELLQSSEVMTLFNTSDPAMRTGSVGEETAAQVNAEIPDGGFDLVIMNPPFTRATNHEGAHASVVNPAFAAFNADKADMDDMGQRLNQLGKGSCYHGNAGIASAFAALAHRKLKPGGVLALVLPLSVAAGVSWQKFRDLLRTDYTDLTVLSIAANGRDMAFSSDTGMAECLVIARKARKGVPSEQWTSFTSLLRRPTSFAPAEAIAKNIIANGNLRGIESGPYGGTRLTVGNELVGERLSVPGGDLWGCVRLLDYSLAQAAYALIDSRLWLPGIADAVDLKVAPLGEVGKLGLVDRDINGPPPRGPFSKVAPSPTATYPCLWNHDAKNETRIICAPDSQLEARLGMEAKAATVWSTASRAHVNREFTFGSQALAAAFTERDSMGGSAWPNVIFDDGRFDYAFAVWGNSTLGLLLYWRHSSRQQSSKARMTVRKADTLPVLDFRALSDEQLATAEGIFDEFRELDLLPAYLADADPNRALLDRRVVCDLLGLDEDTYRAVRRLSAKWCAEPSVHGGKARPKSAQYVE